MSQVEPWHESDCVSYTVIGCCRKDCEVRVHTYGVDGPYELAPEYCYLLEQNRDGKAHIVEFPSKGEGG